MVPLGIPEALRSIPGDIPGEPAGVGIPTERQVSRGVRQPAVSATQLSWKRRQSRQVVRNKSSVGGTCAREADFPGYLRAKVREGDARVRLQS